MKQIDLLNDKPKKLFWHYLLPSISATLVTSIYVLADTVMIGKGVGIDGIAALNILLPLFTLFFGTGLLFGVGGAVLMSVAHGSNDFESGRRYFTTSVIAAVCAAIAYLLIFTTMFEPIVYALGATKVTFSYAKEYGSVLVLGAPVFIFSSMLQAFVRNDKDPNLAMAGVITGGVTNIVLDYIFIYKLNMGMKGGAVATVIGSSLTVLILLLHFTKKSNQLRFIKGGFSFRNLGKIVTNGLSSFLVEIANGVITCLFNLQLVAYIGDIGVTVYSIIANSAIVVMSLANGVAQAAQPILATNYGAAKPDRVKEVRNLGILVSSVIGAVIVVIGMAAPVMITNCFVHATDEILALSVPAIRMYTPAFFFVCINIFFSNYFQSVMKPQFAMAVTITRGLVLSAAFVLVLPMLLGAQGIWISVPLTEILTVGLVLFLNSKMKKS